MRLANPDQAKGALLHLVGQLIQVFGGDAKIFHRFADIVIVAPHHGLNAGNQALGLLQRGLQLREVLPDGVPQLINGCIHIRDRRVRVVHQGTDTVHHGADFLDGGIRILGRQRNLDP